MPSVENAVEPSQPSSVNITSDHDVDAILAEPLQPSSSSAVVHVDLDRKALLILMMQHLSNSWGLRTAEFAVYLLLIAIFPDSLLPASVFGFITTGVAIFLSAWTGHQVDSRHNLHIVRTCIIVLKLAACCMYIPSLALLLYDPADKGSFWRYPLGPLMFSLIVIAGCVHKIAGIAITIAIERDWVMTIAEDSSAHLTVLNTYIRRIDLLCKLLAPLFVSLLTTVASYQFAAIFLCGVEAVCIVFELLWIFIVYRRFVVLRIAQASKEALHTHNIEGASLRYPSVSIGIVIIKIKNACRSSVTDWVEFVHNPAFLSSLSISFLYFTVLSFDGTMLSYLKAQDYSDAFLAGMRGVNVVAGLLGTLLMPYLERKVGLIRAGNWSIWSEFFYLVPVIVAFFAGAPAGLRLPAWNAILLFGGMMLSRIGLWAFDLCQLKELQIALASHPRRNTLVAHQFSLQNIADMLKYALTIALSDPSQFKYAALASLVSVLLGAITYLAYVKKERGHVFHIYITERTPLIGHLGWRH